MKKPAERRPAEWHAGGFDPFTEQAQMLEASDEEAEAPLWRKKHVKLDELLSRPCWCGRRVCLQQFASQKAEVEHKRQELRKLTPEAQEAWLFILVSVW